LPVEIVPPGTTIDFIGRWRIAVILSIALLVAGAIGVGVRGFRLGIDFAGGTEVQVHFEDGVDVDEGDIRAVTSGLGIQNASVIRYGEGTQDYLIKFQGDRQIQSLEPDVVDPKGFDPENDRILQLEGSLEETIGPLRVERAEFVGPKVGAELREDGLEAMGWAGLLILAYIAFRFTARFAPGAVIALIHDVLITSSIWVLLGLEFDLRVLAALLAIIGYSLNDTIIVYDRIRENLDRHGNRELQAVLNQSVNQTLSRTLLTSITTLAAVTSLLVLGGEVIRPFALAMAIGVFVGTYSSVFIASPTLLWLEKRYGKAGGGAARRGKPKGARARA
jgi:preprotein translocase subunit SecF